MAREPKNIWPFEDDDKPMATQLYEIVINNQYQNKKGTDVTLYKQFVCCVIH